MKIGLKHLKYTGFVILVFFSILTGDPGVLPIISGVILAIQFFSVNHYKFANKFKMFHTKFLYSKCIQQK